jgi:hypothetical protein
MMTKIEVVRVLRNAGFLQLADEAARSLPDEVDVEQVVEFGARHGITTDDLANRMGGSP